MGNPLGIHITSDLFNFSFISCYNPWLQIIWFINTWIESHNSEMGSSVYYVIYVQSFVIMFDRNFIDRDGANLIKLYCIYLSINNGIKQTHIF